MGTCAGCRRTLRIKPFLGLALGVAFAGGHLVSARRLSATSVVALIDQPNQRLLIAADCRVSRSAGSASACKIIQVGDCTVAMAGLYEEGSSDFHLRELVRAACQVPGDLRARAEAFVSLARGPYEHAAKNILKGRPAEFARTFANKPTEVVFAGIQDGRVGLIVRGLVADSAGQVRVERFESTGPAYSRIGYFVGLNGHIRRYLKTHPDWGKEDFARLAPQLVELEIEAHPNLAGLPVSELQLDNKGDVVWLAKGACEARHSD